MERERGKLGQKAREKETREREGGTRVGNRD